MQQPEISIHPLIGRLRKNVIQSNMGTVFLALLLSPVAEKKKPNGFLHSISLILLSASVHSTSGVVLLLTLVHSFI